MSRAMATTILRTVSAALDAAVGDLVQLGHAVDQRGDLLAELRAQVGQRVAGVLHGVVQEGGGQGRPGHAQVGQDLGHRQRVGDVGLTRAALLLPVQLLGRHVGLDDHPGVALRVELPQRPQDGLELRGRA